MVSHWLGAASYRVRVLNIAMLVLLLALLESASLFALVGGACLVVAGVAGLRRAMRASLHGGAGRAAFDRVRQWLPGAAALALGALGLHLAVNSPQGSGLYLAGVLLFGFELVMLVVPAEENVASVKAA